MTEHRMVMIGGPMGTTTSFDLNMKSKNIMGNTIVKSIYLLVILSICAWNMHSLRSWIPYLQQLSTDIDIIIAAEHRLLKC